MPPSNIAKAINPDEAMAEFYNGLYTHEKHDSPEKSRVSLAKRIRSMLLSVDSPITNKNVLNIGSGPQALERQILCPVSRKVRRRLNDFNFFTLDRAEIPEKRFLAKDIFNVTHVKADATQIPFDDATFGLVVSNHAIDFAPRKAFDEARRVLSPEGKAIFYFHHAHLLIDLLKRDCVKGKRNHLISLFTNHLKEENVLFASEEEIQDCLTSHGFSPEEINTKSDYKDIWWEVVANPI